MYRKTQKKGKVQTKAKRTQKSKVIPFAGEYLCDDTPTHPDSKKRDAENASREKFGFPGSSREPGFSTLGCANKARSFLPLPEIGPALKAAIGALGEKFTSKRDAPKSPKPTLEAGGVEYRSLPDCWDALALREQDDYAARLQALVIYEATKRLPCFDIAKEAWLEAFRRRSWGKRYEKLSASELTTECLGEIVLFAVGDFADPAIALQTFAPCIQLQAEAGKIGFFKRLAKALENKKAKTSRRSVSSDLLRYWLSGMLWLMTYDRAAAALQSYTGRCLSPEQFERERRRLRLKRYLDFNLPILIACHAPNLTAKFALTRAGEVALRMG